MKIKVWTKQPNRFIREATKLMLKRRVRISLNGEEDKEWVRFEDLSLAQFNSLEDTAVRMGLTYDGSQEERTNP